MFGPSRHCASEFHSVGDILALHSALHLNRNWCAKEDKFSVILDFDCHFVE
jgi:hypothetical protein